MDTCKWTEDEKRKERGEALKSENSRLVKEIATLTADRDRYKYDPVLQEMIAERDQCLSDIGDQATKIEKLEDRNARHVEQIAALEAELARWKNVAPDRCNLEYIIRLETDNANQVELIKRLREALEKLARLGNEPMLGNSVGNVIAQAALKQEEGLNPLGKFLEETK